MGKAKQRRKLATKRRRERIVRREIAYWENRLRVERECREIKRAMQRDLTRVYAKLMGAAVGQAWVDAVGRPV